MFQEWWEYEWARIKRAFKETSWKTFLGWSFVLGCLGLIGQWKTGVQSEHDTLIKIAVASGCSIIGCLCALSLKLMFLPAKMAAEQQKTFNTVVKEHDAKIKSSAESHAIEIHSLQTENTRLKNQIDDDTPKATVNATMKSEFEGQNGSFAKLTIRVKNLGKNTITIEKVIMINPFKEAPENEALLEFETEPVIEVPPKGSLKDISFTFRKRPEYMPLNQTGEETGNGYIHLTTGEKFQYTLTYLRDIEWAFINRINKDLAN